MDQSAYFLDSAAYASEAPAAVDEPDCYSADKMQFEKSAYGSYLESVPTGEVSGFVPRGGDLYASDDDATVDQEAIEDNMNPYQLDQEEASKEIQESKPEPKLQDNSMDSLSKPAEAPLKPSAAQKNFNLQFQQIMELEDSETKYEKMSQLANDFAYVAESYGKIIIAEKSLPIEQKTVKPINVGGVAGGDKFIVSGILFKFAAGDSSINIYGNEENAQKIASHELLGLNSFFLTGVPGLSYPLMALVHYLGFCVVAISVIPIGKDTLKYGSSDAGVTMHFENPSLYNNVKAACQKLNLKPHRAGLNPKPDDPLQYGPGDIEGHQGSDGRFYMLDFARLMPPECPLPGQIREKGSLFFQLLRPELVKSNAVPLSSDALTGWGMKDPDRAIHNREVLNATLRLRQIVIPGLVSQLTKEYQAALETNYRHYARKVYSENLTARLHAAGVNLRHLGLVRKATTNEPLRALLLCEMIARVFKCKLNGKLRRTVTSDIGVEFEKCRTIVADVLCLLLRVGEDEAKIKRWWTEKLKYILEVKFQGGLTHEELADDYDLWNAFEGSEDASRLHKEVMFTRFIYTTKVQLTENAQKHAADSWSGSDADGPTLILPSDVLTLLPRTKNAVIGDLFFTFSKYMHAVRVIKQNPAVSGRLLELVLTVLKKAPQISSIFYEKLLMSTIGPVMSNMDPSSSIAAKMLSDILDASLTASLIQRYGLGQEDFSSAISKEYVHAARIMRKSGSLDSARWMIGRAANFGAMSVDLELEKWKLGNKSSAYDVLQKYPDNADVCWMWMKHLFSTFATFRLVLDVTNTHRDEFPDFLRSVSVVARDAPRFFSRREWRNQFVVGFQSILVYCCQPSVWATYDVDSHYLDDIVDVAHRNLAPLENLTFPRMTLNDLAANFFSKRHKNVQWNTKSMRFMNTTISSANISLLVRTCATSLRVLSLHQLHEPLDSLDFLKQLPALRKLSLTMLSFTNPAVIGTIPNFVQSHQLDALHLDGIEGITPEDVSRCLSYFSRLTNVGLPFVDDAPSNSTDAALQERTRALQTKLLEIYTPYFANLTHLRFRGVRIPTNFVERLKPALDSAANLKLIDFSDASGILDFHTITSLSLPNLLVLITQSGEPIWFSGPTKRVVQASKGYGTNALNWYCGMQQDQSPDYKDALEPYIEEHLYINLGARSDFPNSTNVVPVCVTSVTTSAVAKVIDFGRVVFNLVSNGDTPVYKSSQDVRIGYAHNHLCVINQLPGNVIITVGANKVQLNAQFFSGLSEVKLWDGNRVVRENHQWTKVKFEIQPGTCISAMCAAFLVGVSLLR